MSKKNVRDQRKPKRNRIHPALRIERLESRMLLTGYSDITLDDHQMNTLIAGLEGIGGLGDRISETGDLAQPIHLVKNPGGGPMTPGGLAPIGRTFDEDIGNPAKDFFGSQPAEERTTNEFITYLTDFDGDRHVNIEGGYVLEADEIQFVIHFTRLYEYELVDLDFGSPGHEKGIGISNGVRMNLKADMEIRYTIGMKVDPSLSVEQAFFLRDMDTQINISADTIFDPFTLGIGILEASVPDVTLDATLYIQVGDRIPNPLGEFYLSEINSLSVELLYETFVDTNFLTIDLVATASLGSWTVSGSPTLQYVGSLIGVEPTISTNADFSELLLFNRITVDDLVDGQERLGAWFSSLMDTDLFDIDIPFTAGSQFGSVYDVGAGYGDFTRTLRGTNGEPTFETAQSFPYSTADGIDYDPVTDQLTYYISRNLPTQRTESRASRLFVDEVLGIQSDDRAEIDADGRVTYHVSFDLSDETASINERMLFKDLRIRGNINPSLSALGGDAAYGGLGISYTDAVITGDYSYDIQVGDSDPLVRTLSLGELNNRLIDPATLLDAATSFGGTSQLRLTGLSVRDGLFALAANSALVASVPDFLSGAVNYTLENASQLASFETLTFENVAASLSLAILGTEEWSSMGDDAVATVGRKVEDFASIRQQKIVNSINDGIDSLQNDADTSRLILQDLPAFLQGLTVSTQTGLIEFTSSIDFDAVASKLELRFDALTGTTVPRLINFGFGFDALELYTSNPTSNPLIEGTDNFVGQKASANTESSAKLSLGLEVDASNPSSPVVYVQDTAELTTSIYVDGSGVLAMDGAVGAVGVEFTDGRLVIAQNLTAPDPLSPALFQTRVPSGHGRVRLSDFLNFQPTLTSLGQMQADFEVVPDSTGKATPERFTFQVGNLASALTSTLLLSSPSFPDLRDALDLPKQLQSVPPSLDALFESLELNLKEQVLGINLPLIGKALDGPANFIRDLRAELNTAFLAINNFNVATIERRLERAIEGLMGVAGDYVKADVTLPTEIRFTLAFNGAPISETLQTTTDVGLPALGASLDAELTVLGTYDFEIAFVVSVTEGVYLDTSKENISINLDVDLNGTAQGRLGFVEVTATPIPSPSCDHAFHALFNVGLTDLNQDGKLKIDELFRGPVIDMDDTGLTGCAGMSFQIVATATDWLPSFVADLNIEWPFDGTDLQGQVPVVSFDNVGLKLGPFLEKVLVPLFARLEPILDPIEPLLDLLTTPIPNINASIIDMAQALADALPGSNFQESIDRVANFLLALDSLNDLANAVQIEKGTGAVIDVGSLTFGGSGSQYDARLGQLASSVVQLATARGDVMGQFNSAVPQTSAKVSSSPAQIHFPILEQPLSIFEWMLGFGEAEIVTVDLPELGARLSVDFPIPIIPGILQASIYGSIGVELNIGFGIDTYGAWQYKKTGNAIDFLQGFYISDRENADGTGEDVAELPITGKLLAGVGLGFDVGGIGLSAEVYGGLVAEIGLDLIDPNQDGKVRGDELSSPRGCLAINSSVGLTLEAHATVAIFHWEFPFAYVELANDRRVIHCEPPVMENLAKLNRQTGELELLVGTQASRRSIEPDAKDEEFTVLRNGQMIEVYAFGGVESFNANEVTRIYADAGDGDDNIFIDPNINVPATILGGDGDDILQGAGGMNNLDGGNGKDILYGGSNNDILTGGDGDDQIHGDSGNDTINGDDGDDIIYGGANEDTIDTGEGLNFAYGDEDNDTIVGGSLRDVIYGGTGNDSIDGKGGRNVLMGETGLDTITGGNQDDVIDGGDDDDEIHGLGGQDRIYGGDGVDEIDGDDGEDYVEGGRNSDTIRGGRGDDIVYGGDQADTIFGGPGADQLFGERGEDTIHGNDGIDTIFGGESLDNLFGDEDNDIIHGDSGPDSISGGWGSDELYGDDGQDTIYGDVDSVNAVTLPVGVTDDDTIFGGSDSDDLFGGVGRDTIYGQQGLDTIEGNEDADTLSGDDGDDRIYGFGTLSFQIGGVDGQDLILGGLGSDRLWGGPEADRIRGGKGNDDILGEDGEDTLFGDEGNDTIDGGPQIDTIDGGVDNDHILGAGDDDLLYGSDGIDTIEGNQGADFIRGNNHADFLFGNDGDDDIAGNSGNDFIHGNDGDDDITGDEDADLIYGDNGDDDIDGNDGADVIYGDDGQDEITGGSGNDTIRGGNDRDTIRGNAGDDLILGNGDDDTIDGDEGNDVLYGNQGDDTIHGNTGDDRIYGEIGIDTLFGDQGDDVLEGGVGNDILSGDLGNDAIYGDGGIDDISGGNGDDFLFAGPGGFGEWLRGDDGNDTIVGSDDGTDDNKLQDTTYFGDRLDGGLGDDTIDGLGGADIINGGSGRDILRGGVHGDWIIGGPAASPGVPDEDEIYGHDGDDTIDGGDGDDHIRGGSGINTIDGGLGTNTIDPSTDDPIPIFDMSEGPERRGPWAELSGSANAAGLTQIGGFEQSILATELGVYVTWVDWRNGNSEIYVAYHPNDLGVWQPLDGFDGQGSANGGGISNDASQSRRPTLFIPPNEDDLFVAWTSIESDGTTNIEVARLSTNWTRMVNPGQNGAADHAKFVPYSTSSGLLAWIDNSGPREQIAITQFVNEPSCFVGFIGGAGIAGGVPGGPNITSFDLDAVEFRAGIAYSYGDSVDHDIDVFLSGYNTTTLCAATTPVSIYQPSFWNLATTISDGDATEPTIGLQLIGKRSMGPFEEQVETDVYVAWHRQTDREDQVDAIAIRHPFEGVPSAPQKVLPQYSRDTVPRTHSSGISDTIGYAAKPDLAVTNVGANLAWMDDGVLLADGRSSIFVMSNFGNFNYPVSPYVLHEFAAGDASSAGISSTGDSAQSVSISAPRDAFSSTTPYVAWTEAAVINGDSVSNAPTSGVYLRVTQYGPQIVDDNVQTNKETPIDRNILSNDHFGFGEFPARVVQFDGREIPFNTAIEFISELGATVRISSTGDFHYDPTTSSILSRLRARQTRTETFLYRLSDGINDSEGLVNVVTRGVNRWHNLKNQLDVDDDGTISPLDVLTLINDINQFGVRELQNPAIGQLIRFLDVDDDGTISPIDVLMVINWLNSRSSGQGEGEANNGNRLEPSKSNDEVAASTQWLVSQQFMIDGLDENFTNGKRRVFSPPVGYLISKKT